MLPFPLCPPSAFSSSEEWEEQKLEHRVVRSGDICALLQVPRDLSSLALPKLTACLPPH